MVLQIELTEPQRLALEQIAGVRGVSVVDLVRSSVEDLVRNDDERRRRALSVIGRFRSGHRDLSSEHDRHLADAFGE
jgi:hypothetical protein